jgi:hypothetical protein
MSKRTCPDCDGRGWLLEFDRLEAAAKAWNVEWGTEYEVEDRDVVKAALLAYLTE